MQSKKNKKYKNVDFRTMVEPKQYIQKIPCLRNLHIDVCSKEHSVLIFLFWDLY